jgi:hypothetical protein
MIVEAFFQRTNGFKVIDDWSRLAAVGNNPDIQDFVFFRKRDRNPNA